MARSVRTRSYVAPEPGAGTGTNAMTRSCPTVGLNLNARDLELARHQQPQLAALLAHHRRDRGEAVGAVEADGGGVGGVDAQRERLAVHVARDLQALIEQLAA